MKRRMFYRNTLDWLTPRYTSSASSIYGLAMTVIASAAKQSRKLSYKIQRFFLIITLFAGLSAAGVKYVAVVESDVDESSGASEKISRADVRLVTAELRREAVKNLPPKKYSIMTTETVIAQGSAVLSECHEENCVISLGSTIGADYIVRGTVSKIENEILASS